MNAASQTVCFTLPSGTEYCVTLLTYEHINQQLQITIEADAVTWESIDLLTPFNLQLNFRTPGRISGKKPVQITLYLDKKIYEELSLSNNLLISKKSFLESDGSHPMRDALNWFATEVTEEVDLPKELESLGTLREGFTTKWKAVYA